MPINLEPVSPVLTLTEDSEIKKQFGYFSQYPLLIQFIDAMPSPVMVLNKQRQVVYSNKALLNITGKTDLDLVFGLFPGDVLNCSHAAEKKHGCGTSEFCITCGALKSILSANISSQNIQECRIIKTNNEALDLRVYSSPLKFGDDELTIFTITDISDENRRKNLERIFFHDLLNTASTVKSLAFNLETASGVEATEFRSNLVKMSDNLVEEICAQRDIYAAEINELMVYLSRCNSMVMLNDIFQQFNYFRDDKKIIIDERSDNCEFFTDKILMRRILSNMLKNALEATFKESIITIGCRKNDETLEFWVHNPGFIEKEVQLQIFQRSFSTKGKGRGIGTYSMKLLAENYLRGKISFTSDPAEGTVFLCSVPLNYE
jgi:signal transduction histidine kinase